MNIPFIYYPNWNIIRIAESGQMNLHVTAGLLIVIFTILIYGLGCLGLKMFNSMSLSGILKRVTICFFLVLCFIQLLNQGQYALKIYKSFAKLTMSEKYIRLYGESYAFTQFVHQYCPETCFASLRTDLDQSQTLEPYILKYFLYPKVNLLDTNSDPRCLVVFQSKDPKAGLPQNFKMIRRFNETSLFAMKE